MPEATAARWGRPQGERLRIGRTRAEGCAALWCSAFVATLPMALAVWRRLGPGAVALPLTLDARRDSRELPISMEPTSGFEPLTC